MKRHTITHGLLLLALAACRLDAANWYVDNAVGSSGSGTSWGSAWKNFSNVVWGAGGVQAGDTLNISGGSTSKTYTETWTVGASGTSGSRITIRTGQDAGHNGTVIFNWQSHVTVDGNGAERTAVAAAINADGRSYVTFSGNVGGQIKMQMKNLYDVIDRQDGKAISAASTAGFIVEYVEFRNMNNGAVISSSTAATVRFCDFLEIRGDRAINFTGGTSTFDTTLFHDNYINCLKNWAKPPGAGSASYTGPDGIQCPGAGVSVFRNTFVMTAAASGVYTSTQHPDMIQGNAGTHMKIYDNDFIDVGDSAINFEWANQQNPHDIRIFNNVFRITNLELKPFPTGIRMYASSSATPLQTVTNVKILNNTFIDNGAFNAIRAGVFVGSTPPTGSGNEIKNNLFYNVGAASGSTSQTVRIEPSAANLGWAFDGNVYYTDPALSTIAARVKYNTTTYTASDWIAANEPNGSTSAPAFVDYQGYQDPDNDVQLAATPPGGTIDLSAYFTVDKNGVTRSGWSPGAYEFVGNDLVGHWKLDENSGTSAADSSGNGHTGTLENGPTWTTGTLDNGLSFDATDDIVDAGSGSTLDNLSALTIAAWIKADSVGEGNTGRIVKKGTGNNPSGGFRFLMWSTATLSFSVDYSTTDLTRTAVSNSVSLGDWQHVAVTWNGSATATNVHIYVNGSEVGSYDMTTNGAGSRGDDSAANLYLGNDSVLSRTFDGVIDDVRLYNRVLSGSEILAIYQGSPPGSFALTTPSNAATDVATTSTLDWGDSSGANSYTLVVDNNSDFSSPVINQTGIASSQYTVGTALANGTTYYWKVTAVNGAGSTPASNNNFSFTTIVAPPGAFSLSSPANGSTGVSTTPTLDWGDSTGATTYTLVVDDDSDFSSPTFNQGGIASSTYAVGTALASSTTYYWKVTAVNAGGSTAASNNNFSFTTSGSPPGTFALTSPTGGTTGLTTKPTLDWADSTGATSYTLTVDDDSDFSTPLISQSGLGSSHYSVTSALGNNTLYYWKVTAVNGAGSTLASNNGLTFTTGVGAPVAHWMLDEGSGTTATDSSGNGHDGTLENGPAWTAGQVGGGLGFDGGGTADDIVNAGSGSMLDNLSAITVSAWIKPNSVGEGNTARIVKKGTGNNPTGGFRFLTTSQASNGLSFCVDYSTTDLVRISSSDAITMGTWQHVVATWTGSDTATNVKLYVNGVEVSGYSTTTNGAGSRGDDSAANLYLGNDSVLSRTFDGVLDDVRVYNSVLTPSEILSLYQGTLPAAPSSLTATKISYEQVNLSWADNAVNESGYKIERKKGAGGTYAQIDTVVANSTSYSDTDVGAGTTYYYRVRATNAAGDSPYSNESSATTDEITSGRQGHWKLDETSGTSAADSSGNGNTGTLQNGPTWTTGQLGGGLSFDGGSTADDVVNAGSGSTLDNLSAITVSAWIKPNSVGEGNTARIVKKGTGNNPTGGWRFLTTSQASNGLSFCVDYSTTDLVRISSADAITMGTWQHVVATWSGSGTATNVKLYVNGVEVSGYATTTDGAGTRGDDSTANLYLGNDSVLSRTFDGVLDDVRVYNRVLSAAEIQAVYAAGL